MSGDEAVHAPSEKSERKTPSDHAEEVAHGILRIMLPIELPGLGHVNCYAIEDSNGVALIDPGLADGVSHNVLSERLNSVGLDILDVHTAVTTHGHFDHYGGVVRLKSLDTTNELRVCAHTSFGQNWHSAYDSLIEDHDEDSAVLEARTDAEVDAYLTELSGRLRRTSPWGPKTDGFPPEMLRAWSTGIKPVDTLRPPTSTHPLDDGEQLSLGGRQWEIIHTPGHADDHICLWNEELGVLFSGDHLLPHITPHISAFSSYEDPLGQFFRSLEKVERFEGETLVLPAHGDPFADATGRAKAIREHHDGRLDRVREIGGEIGDQRVEEYMKLLFRERSWGMMAASETYAHLEWLRVAGEATRRDESASVYFRL